VTVNNIKVCEGLPAAGFPSPTSKGGRPVPNPAAGNGNDSNLNNTGSNGNYWSSTPNSDNSNNAWNLNFNSSNFNRNNNNRYNGQSVRPIRALATKPVDGTPHHLLEDLYKAYLAARRHKRGKGYQIRFEMKQEHELVKLRDELAARRYEPRPSSCFIIHDPVQREVFAASFRDRIVHHLIFSYLNPLFEPLFIGDSYSCRVGKGTHYGVQRMMEKMRKCRQDNLGSPVYVLKLDIQGYFMNINRQRLYEKIIAVVAEAKIDYGLVDYLLKEIIFNDPTRGCRMKGRRSDWNGLPPSKSLFNSSLGCGLPIGNLTSQLFSNAYLSALDDFVTKELKIEHYGRYVDDFYLIDSSKDRLLDVIPKIRNFLMAELNLSLHPRKVYLQNISKGVKYLGYWVFPDSAKMTHSAYHRVHSHIVKALTEFDDPFYGQSVIRSCHSQKVW